MALDLYMLGLIVHDMDTSLTFYRRLGLAIPDGSEAQTHVEVKMGGELTFFLTLTRHGGMPTLYGRMIHSAGKQQAVTLLSWSST